MSQPNKVRIPDEIPRKDLELVIGALVKRFTPVESVRLTQEEIDDAPDVEVRRFFETDEIEMRVAR
jgi:hypothetical protein